MMTMLAATMAVEDAVQMPNSRQFFAAD